MTVRVQQEDFDIGAEIAALTDGRTDIGAVVTFTGLVRDVTGGASVSSMELEHYPGMTERELGRIEEEANTRWRLQASLIVHRVGKLAPGDNIVLVVTASGPSRRRLQGRRISDGLPQDPRPFWKREVGSEGDRWVEARDSDDEAAKRWNEKGG